MGYTNVMPIINDRLKKVTGPLMKTQTSSVESNAPLNRLFHFILRAISFLLEPSAITKLKKNLLNLDLTNTSPKRTEITPHVRLPNTEKPANIESIHKFEAISLLRADSTALISPFGTTEMLSSGGMQTEHPQ